MYTEVINTRFNETDAFGHINNTVYPIWFDACRKPIIKLFAPSLEPKDMHLILAHTSNDFLREVFYSKEVIIKTALEKIGNTSMTIIHGLYQDNELCTVGKAVMIHFNKTDKKAIPIPTHVRLELEKHIQKNNWSRILNTN